MYVLFFCKQKTAYEMRISDWSSDVCSSDLARGSRSRKSTTPSPKPAQQPALLQRLAAVRGRLSLCADQAAAAKWWLSMPMASVSAEGPMPKAQIGRASCRERVCQYV